MKNCKLDPVENSPQGEERMKSGKSDPRKIFSTLKETNPQLVPNLAQGGHTNSQLCLNLDEGGRTDNRIAENGYMEGKDKYHKNVIIATLLYKLILQQ